MLRTAETSSLDYHFCCFFKNKTCFFKNKTNFYSPLFLPKCCKNKFLCIKILLRIFSHQKNLTKTVLLFGRIFLLSFFPFSSCQEEHFCKQRKPDSLFFSLLFLLNLLSLSCRIFMFTLLVVALLIDKKIGKIVLLFSFAHFSKKKILLFGRIFLFFFLFSSIKENHFLQTNTCFISFIALYLSL